MSMRRISIGFWGLVFAVVLAIWVSGYWRIGRWTYFKGLAVGCRRVDNQFQLFGGAMTFKAVWYYDLLHPTEDANTIQRWDYKWGDFLGFRITPYFPNRSDWYFAVGFPFWFLLTVSAWFFVRAIRKRGNLPGVCAKCGYDLRASTARCPECGMSIKRLEPIAAAQSL